MAVDIKNIVNLVTKLGAVYNSPLSYLVSMAYDLERLIQLISNDSDLHNKFLNFLAIPLPILNEKSQIRRDILKQFISEISINNNVKNKTNIISYKNASIKYICFDKILTAIKQISNIVKNTNEKLQIVTTDTKIRKLVKCQFRVKPPIDEAKYTDNVQIKKIIKTLNDIVIDDITIGNVTISDISNIKYDCNLTVFLDINPNVAWSNDIGHLWLSGYERELLDLTTRIDWNAWLNVSSTVYIFSKQADLPLWQQMHLGSIEYLTTTYPKLHENVAGNEELRLSNFKTELTVNANGVSDLLHNPYLFYLKNILDLKPKKHFTDDTSKIFDIFGRLLKSEPTEQVLNELKDIDYFYYKKIQSFMKQIPQQNISLEHISIDGLTVIYKNKISSHLSNITEINHYVLSSSLSAKDIVSGHKTNLMIQALSTETDAIRFNVISPDWHSFNGVNKRSVELSREILNEYRDNIKTAWKNFLQTEVFKLEFDKDKASSVYKHLERV